MHRNIDYLLQKIVHFCSALIFASFLLLLLLLAKIWQVLIVELQTDIVFTIQKQQIFPHFYLYFAFNKCCTLVDIYSFFYLSHTQFEIKTDDLLRLDDYTVQLTFKNDWIVFNRNGLQTSICLFPHTFGLLYPVSNYATMVMSFFRCCCRLKSTLHKINHVKMLNLFYSVFQNDTFDCDFVSVFSICLPSIYISNQPFCCSFCNEKLVLSSCHWIQRGRQKKKNTKIMQRAWVKQCTAICVCVRVCHTKSVERFKWKCTKNSDSNNKTFN